MLGQHQGSWFHTIGQRKGLGLGQGPWFVVDKNLDENLVYVAHPNQFKEHSKSSFYLTEMNWINGEPDLSKPYLFKLRHGPSRTLGRIEKLSQCYKVSLEQADSGLAPGQHAVIYNDTHCLGGGMIYWKEIQ